MKIHLVMFDDGLGSCRVEAAYFDFEKALNHVEKANGVGPNGEEFMGPYYHDTLYIEDTNMRNDSNEKDIHKPDQVRPSS